ncbi:MAG: hypothetical protein PWR20_2086 [Bacteroidales bacterium]|jgi:ferredoxin|nr:hypothetical protein [Bacteroidales bacterium]MDN5329458.1 hypothetical protein [Bacteroidales bacterium]
MKFLSIRLKTSNFAMSNLKNTIVMAYVITEDCVACGTCIDECPVGAISEGDIYKIDPDVCTDCGSCAEVCPTEAIHPAE